MLALKRLRFQRCIAENGDAVAENGDAVADFGDGSVFGAVSENGPEP